MRPVGLEWDAGTQWEREFWGRGFTVAGVDEAGRGPLAGPVVAAAVILDPTRPLHGVGDSKTLSPERREALLAMILEQAVAVGVGMVGPREIERLNILEATRVAMRLALAELDPQPGVVLTDAAPLGGPWREWALLRADGRSVSVAAASVVAKVVRDRYMVALDRQFPVYRFARHKGYGTPEHLEALRRYGPCEAHRRGWRGT
ncbi:MAG: ribonuclease HII [Firmicutes bacterium]|nr:ribonuclease HII [Alicyclobacillaceae bacterium]MCL6496359.1 ribonuclease HII [Bacillota bacterium]